MNLLPHFQGNHGKVKNPEQGSATAMVGQNAHTFPVPDIFNAPLTPRQAERAAQFLAMLTLKAAPDVAQEQPQEPAAPRCRSYQELAAERRAKSKAHRRPRKATPPAAWVNKAAALLGIPEQAEERPAWLITPEEIDALEQQAKTEAAPVVRVPAQPVPELAELLNLEQFRPRRGRGAGTAGAGALAELLHECARRHLKARPHLYNEAGYPPRQVVLHLSAEMLAACLGVSDNTIREWAAQLQAVGYVQAHGHKTTSTNAEGERVTMADGTLYAVRLAPGHTARLRYADYKKQYRDLDADRKAGRTAYNAIRWAEQRAMMRGEQESDQHAEKNTSVSIFTQQDSAARAEIRRQVYRWAVIPGNVHTQDPLKPDSELFQADELDNVQDVVYLLPTLSAAHHTKRAALVGIMAATLSRALNDQHSRLYWCKTIWQAWQEELEGRDGLQHLAAQLQRLEIDRREWGELRNPAAVFAARQRAV